MVWRTLTEVPVFSKWARSWVKHPIFPLATTSAPVAKTALAFFAPS